MNLDVLIEDIPICLNNGKLELADPGNEFACGFIDLLCEVNVPAEDPEDWMISEIFTVGNPMGKDRQRMKVQSIPGTQFEYLIYVRNWILQYRHEDIISEIHKAEAYV